MELLALDIINSNRVDFLSSTTRRDILDDRQWLGDLLGKWGLFPADQVLTPGFIAELKNLRESMGRLVADLNNGTKPHEEALDAFNTVFFAVSARPRLTYADSGFAVEQNYTPGGQMLLLWHIAASFADLLQSEDRSRIKICRHDDCEYVFFDSSKNKSRRWCDDKVCGNILKARRFRSRQKAEAGKAKT